MRLILDLPAGLLERARRHATATGLTVSEVLVSALARHLSPPTIGGPANLHLLTREELDEAMFGLTTAPAASSNPQIPSN